MLLLKEIESLGKIAIASVLHSDVKRIWDIATVVDTIFVEKIPLEVKKKVRLQITNLLASGARENHLKPAIAL